MQDRHTKARAKVNLYEEYYLLMTQHLRTEIPLAGGAGTFLGTGTFSSETGFLGISGTLKILFSF